MKLKLLPGSEKFYVHFLTVLTFFQIPKVYSKIGFVYYLIYCFWYFRNKDHWLGLRLESKLLKVCNLLSYYFWTLKPIIDNNVVWNLLFKGRYKSYFMNIEFYCHTVNKIFSLTNKRICFIQLKILCSLTIWLNQTNFLFTQPNFILFNFNKTVWLILLYFFWVKELQCYLKNILPFTN